jgi:hypothetical protein
LAELSKLSDPLEGFKMVPFILGLAAETTSDQEILVGDALVLEVYGPQLDETALRRARKRFYRLVSEIPSQHRLPAFKGPDGRWSCRRTTVMAYRAARQAWLADQERKALAASGLATADELTPDEHEGFAALPEEARPLFLAFYRRQAGVAQKAA